MTDIIDDTEIFTIPLTEPGEPEPSKTSWVLLGVAIVLLYLLTRR